MTMGRSILGLGFAGLLLAGCTTPTSSSMYEQPTLTPLQITISTNPPPDSNGQVVRDAVISVGLDDYPDPGTAIFGALLLRSGSSAFDVDMRVDLVDRAIVVTPRGLLASDTQYEMVVGGQVAALSGRTVGTTMIAPIAVGSELSPTPSPSPSPAPLVTWNDDIQPLLSQCAPYCHTPDRCPGASGKRHPTSNLDLSGDPTDPILGLIRVASQELAGTDLPLERVVPGDSGNSMLMRKLLGGDPHADTADPPTADLAVPGRRMPLYESPCGAPLPPPEDVYLNQAQLTLIQQWIDQGAAIQ